MTPEALLQTMRAQRMVWVELEPATDGKPAKRVQIIRPREAEIVEHFLRPSESGKLQLQADLAEVKRFTVGWEGFTEADFIGPAGASSPVIFNADLWAERVADEAAWSRTVCDALLSAIATHQNAKAQAEKNSKPSSKPSTESSTRAKKK